MIFFFVCYFIQTRKPKCAAAKSYSKLVTANHKKKKKGIQALDTLGMKRRREVVPSSVETRIHLLLFLQLITVCRR